MLLKTRWVQFNEMLSKSSNREYTCLDRGILFLDFLFNRLFKGLYLIDYIQYKFYDRNKYSRETFLEYQKLHKIIKKCNNPQKAEIFDSKIMFNKKFKEHLNREWIDCTDCTKDEFVNFLNKHKEVILKPELGSFGMGIKKIQIENFDVDELFEECKVQKAILETIVIQHETLANLNKTSLNTLRVVTLIDRNEKVHIMSAVLRIGREGKVTDNFHSQGLASLIDIETGIVKTTAVDRDFSRYVLHPDSKKVICGFKVPAWEKVKEKAEELAMVIPDVRYVGWDIAVDKDEKIICIEGNYSADPDVTQTTDQVGKYYEYLNKI